MAWRRDARIAETSTSVGTGAVALAGAYDSSYRRFNSRCAVGDKFSYTIIGSDGSWERGIGTYSAANTLTRGTVLQSSSADAAVNFAAASLTVFMDAADRNVDLAEGNQDVALMRHGANQLEVNNGAPGSYADLFARTLHASSGVQLSGGAFMGKQVAVAASNIINLSGGDYFTKTITASATFVMDGPSVPASGTYVAFILDLTNGGSKTLTFMTGTKWAGGTPPTLTVAGRDILGFFTYDGGTTWTGVLLAKDVK